MPLQDAAVCSKLQVSQMKLVVPVQCKAAQMSYKGVLEQGGYCAYWRASIGLTATTLQHTYCTCVHLIKDVVTIANVDAAP